MRILTAASSWDEPTVVTIGNFDGVHRGHQALIGRALTLSRESGRPMVVLTFDPHPAKVLRGTVDHFLITPGELRMHWLAEAGAQWVRVLPFTREFAGISAEQFMNETLARELHAQHVVVGYNFSFGRGGLGNVALLDAWAKEHGIGLDVVEPYRDLERTHDAVSSSRIRELVRAGDVSDAEALLGHPFRVRGTVLEGDHRGRALGAPTLNLAWPAEQVMPPFGVYAGITHLPNHETASAVANFGVRPTFGGDQEPRLEIHLLGNTEGTPYGGAVQFDLLYHLREERRFESPEALKQQIASDVESAERLLAGRR